MIASWLLTLEKGSARGVRRALARPGVECRSEAHGTLVVVTEGPAESLEELRRFLGSRPGVAETSLVARFDQDRRENLLLGEACLPCPEALA